MNYKIERNPTGTATVRYEHDGVRYSFVDPSPGNTEYEAYLAWIAEGNTPSPYPQQ